MLVNFVPLSLTIDNGLPRRATTASITPNTQARERCVCDEGQTLAAEVVHHRENAEPATVIELIAHEVQRPALVHALRDRHWSPCSQRSLATTTPAHLQPFFPIEASELFVVQVVAFTADQDQQASITEPAANSGKLAQPGTQDSIVGTHAAIAHRGPIHRDHLARPALLTS